MYDSLQTTLYAPEPKLLASIQIRSTPVANHLHCHVAVYSTLAKNSLTLAVSDQLQIEAILRRLLVSDQLHQL
jgi:hypothetical protein